ncbi:MAG: alkaline phosphatase family protein [Chitinophagaceae bacterium]|nr:alkaline phosphatase family protein [Chitinophagaceae bacterium]
MKQVRNVFFLVVILWIASCSGPVKKPSAENPKIVIGLMVDQMRWDYLYRFKERYGEGGFKRLLKDGFSCENTLIGHVPTATACGHASVYTGSVPAINGIIENSWYDRSWGREISNVADTTVKIIGSDSKEGRSPRNLLTTTIGDELRIATNYQSKVVGLAIKDRAAILPAGHTANGAFWYDGGKFTTSTYYMDTLPDWVNRFNRVNWKDTLMPEGWNTLYPLETYVLSDADDKDYENIFSGEERPVFPHKKAPVTSTPFGNTLTLSFARAAIEGYHLGEGSFTDMLAISLSTPDRIGHHFGPTSIEQEDNYLRLDKELESFFHYLDDRFGKEGYLFFLTADHGGNQSPGYLKEHRLPTGLLNGKDIVQHVKDAVEKKYGTSDLVLAFNEAQVYINDDIIAKKGLDKRTVADFIAEQLGKEPGIQNAYATATLATATLPERIRQMYINGYNPKRSGDVLIWWAAGWKPGSEKGAEHGNWNPYDAHIPLVWMGHGIHPGKTHRTVGMTDIAPTLAALLNIQMPGGNVGEVIYEIADGRFR